MWRKKYHYITTFGFTDRNKGFIQYRYPQTIGDFILVNKFAYGLRVPVLNKTFIPVSKKDFNKSLITCHGIITGGGFETPAEALYLKKKLMAIPIHGQYEQQCNAAALKKIGVPVLQRLDDPFTDDFNDWMNNYKIPDIKFDFFSRLVSFEA